MSVVCVVFFGAPGVSGTTSEPRTELVSVNNAGESGHGGSIAPAISADGRFVAFASPASNLVPDDTNGVHDIFVRDRQTGTTERVSVDSSGVQGNDHSGPSLFFAFGASLAISADGRYVAFASRATNLVADDTNGVADVFVHDRVTRQTERVSVGFGGPGNNASGITTISVSADGRYVAYDSFASNLVDPDIPNPLNGLDVFVRDRSTAQTERVSVSSTGAQANHGSLRPAISGNGRFVAFASLATNLVEPDVNGSLDVFVYDRESNAVDLVSVTNDGSQGNSASGTHDFGGVGAALSISDDGRFVAFTSIASNLVPADTEGLYDAFVRDRASGTTERVSTGLSGNSDGATISADGRFVAFTLDAGSLSHVFVHDRKARTTEQASIDPSGMPIGGAGAAISADGRFAAFYSFPAGVFVRDRGAPEDAEPPILTVPADMTVDAISPDGAPVTYVASAIDNIDGPVAVTCSPQSGSIFAVGTTTVTCSATDAAGNTATATFAVTVRPFFASFAAFDAEIEIEPDEVTLKALLRLGATSDGIQPGAEAVILRVGSFEVTFPAGSFTDDGHGRLRVRAEAGEPALDARIRPAEGGFEFRVDLPRHLAASLGPSVEVSLAIGNDSGLTTALVDTN